MTYNVHSCGGMDGRVSPRRIARIIEAELPDIVALQEIDLGRQRSRAEDQAELIARLLDMNFEFCPTVTVEGEHYGHAVLSRWPMDVVKRSRLPPAPGRPNGEPRAALWVRINVAGRDINVLTTHLGFRWGEGIGQVRALLGDEWLGGIPKDEPVMLCGDMNLAPATAGHRLLRKRLSDAQLKMKGHSALLTFSTTVPFVRIDHIMLSPHFEVTGVRVPRNDLTRVASDHFPLVVDLQVLSEDAEEPTKKHPESQRRKRESKAPSRS
jgi:endonuclease/exonuclease/phosphatase family metal-dependent hydrolase